MMQRPTATIAIIALFVLLIAYVAIQIFRVPPAPIAIAPVMSTAPAAVALISPLPNTASEQIIDLFQPSPDAVTQQLSASDTAAQIENAMVVSYTLLHCNLMTQQEYADTFNALITHSIRSHLEPDATRAEARVRSIASAAAGSYSMVYSNTPCDDPSLPEKALALKNWRATIFKPAAPAP